MEKEIAIIIPTFNRKNILSNCLHLLQTQNIAPKYIVVVNDGSTDGTQEMLDADFPEVIQLLGDSNLWWTGSVNLGIKYVREHLPNVEGVILQNDDVEFGSNWIAQLLEDVASNPNSLIGCINVSNKDKKTITWAGKDMSTWFATSKYFYRGESIDQIKTISYLDSFDLIGRGIYIPIQVFEDIGLFDYEHFKHCGDTELPLRARMAGFDLKVSCKAIVYDMPDETAAIDKKEYYTLKDFKTKFFDFRSNAYWKYRFYYGKIVSKNIIQCYTFFIFRMTWHFLGFIRRFKLV